METYYELRYFDIFNRNRVSQYFETKEEALKEYERQIESEKRSSFTRDTELFEVKQIR